MKFIHTSDWHLGNNFYRFTKEQNTILNNARYNAVRSIFIYAKKRDIKLIIVSGDQFDNGQNATYDDTYKLLSIIKEYPDIIVVMIAGNHDPLVENSIYSKTEKKEIPHNLIFVEDNFDEYFNELNCRIMASSLKEKNGRNNPLDWIDEKDEQKLRIGIAHGTIAIEGKFNPDDFPLPPDFSTIKKLDYLALGHYHSFSKYNDTTFFCGTPEPMGFDDEGYALEVELNKGTPPNVSKISGIQNFNWIVEKIELNNNNFDSWQNNLNCNTEKNMIKKLVLNGYITIENKIKLDSILNLEKNRYFELIIENNCKIRPSNDEISELSEGYIKNVVDKLISLKNREDNLSFSISENISQEKIADSCLIEIYDFFK